MPVDRTLASDLAQPLLAIYTGLEQRLTADIARRLRADLGRDETAEAKAATVNLLRRLVQTLLSALDKDLDGKIAQQLTLAYARGSGAALRELVNLADVNRPDLPHPVRALLRAVDDPDVSLPRLQRAAAGHHSGVIRTLTAIRTTIPGADAILRMTYTLAAKLRGTHLPILRWALDAYRDVIAAAALPGVLAGVDTRRRASQVAWEELLSRGVTGFVDKAGRRWNLASYVEMATRTGVAQAAVEGHMDRLEAVGLDLVIVSDSPMECFRCRPWEGKVLSRSGVTGARDVQMEHATVDDRMVTVHIAGTVVEAVAAGLMHPNCRHSLSAYLPGVTRVPTNTADPEGEKARERLRALERKVRHEKVQQEAALGPAAAKKHGARVRALQAEIRAHVKAHEHLGLRRKPERERPDLGNRAAAVTPAKAVPVVKPGGKPVKAAVGDRVVSARVAKANTPEERLRTAISTGVQGPATSLTGGAVAEVALVTFADGTRAVRKTAAKKWAGYTPEELTVREELAARVAAVIGAPVPAVVRTGPTEVYMEYIPDAKPAVKVFTKSARGQRRQSEAYNSRDGRALGLLDQITAQGDRHAGNILITPTGAMYGIDHGFAWPPGQITEAALRFRPHSLPGPATYYGSLGQWHTTDLTQADIDWVRDRLLSLRPVFADAGRGHFLDYSLARLEQMRPYAQGTVDRLKPGEG